MIKHLILILVFATSFLSNSCNRKGCTDDKALNFDLDADIDNNSCQFSRCVFYKTKTEVYGYEIDYIEVYGSYPGETLELLPGDLEITVLSGEPNCNTFGTVKFNFADGRNFEWNTKIFLKDTSLYYGTLGVVTPDPYSDCVKVNVTQF